MAKRLFLITGFMSTSLVFKLEGNLKEDDDLQLAVEVYENGKLKEELLTTSDEPKKI